MYSGSFSNGSYNNIKCLFFSLLSYILFNEIYKDIFFDYNDVNFNARLSLLKEQPIFQNNFTMEQIKSPFLLFYDKKESSLTK